MNKLRLVSLLLLLLLPAFGASAQDAVARQQRKIESYRKEIASLEKKMRENEAQKGSAVTRLELIRASIRSRKALVAESDKEIAAYADTIGLYNSKIEILQTRLDTLTAYYAKLVRNAYKNRDPKIWYMFILSSENVGQAFRRMGVLRSLSSQMSVQAEKINATKEELGARKEELAGLKVKAESVRAQRQTEVNALAKNEREAEGIVSQINRNARKYKKEADAKRAELNRLNKELDKLRKELASAKKAGTAKGGKTTAKDASKTVVDKALADDFRRNKKKLPWPADGPVLSSFGSYRHPLHKNVTALKNNGLNISMSAGEPVKVIFNGTVEKSFDLPGYGKCVAVSHGDYLSLYCRLKDVYVKKGDKLTTGQTLGTIGSLLGDVYLHFEIWDGDNKAVNPELWLK